MDDTRIQLKELVDEHLSRATGSDAALVRLLGGLHQIRKAVLASRTGEGGWGPILITLRKGMGDARAALREAQGDAGLASLCAHAERQVAFASVLEDELVRIEEGESTLV